MHLILPPIAVRPSASTGFSTCSRRACGPTRPIPIRPSISRWTARTATASRSPSQGFRPNEIDIVAQQNLLSISGKRAEDEDTGRYLHRGIAARAFERRFQLADYIEVGEARFDHGLLSVDLKRVVPEAMKPRKIAIAGPSGTGRRIEAPQREAPENETPGNEAAKDGLHEAV